MFKWLQYYQVVNLVNTLKMYKLLLPAYINGWEGKKKKKKKIFASYIIFGCFAFGK